MRQISCMNVIYSNKYDEKQNNILKKCDSESYIKNILCFNIFIKINYNHS